MDRAHRLGQKKVVTVYRLITKGTLEQKIMRLQKFKLNIASSVVNKENSSLRSMDTNQLLDLFNYSESSDFSNNNNNNQEEEDDENDSSSYTTPSGINKSVLEGLEELWDKSQYEEEYNIDNFLQSLDK
eukprot:TRINITY_DN467_c4_g1_i1.p1 TRINITY_DN467_c4_g1~~TRINITY_DN467_c4_g1_i1.p1  ORF type:complete len:129 (-),score=50.79 TRINITY_DN467_c4_g1_i1:343-729(-)